MIELFMLPIFDRINTVHFGSNTQREAYFNSPVVTISTGFYPPKFKDTIELEVPINKYVNYMRIEFEDKWYYYFVDDSSYINEGLTRYKITMDTIMTFIEYDRISLISGLLKRNTIRRWINNNDTYLINRDYIRENIKKGEFKDRNYSYYGDSGVGWLILEFQANIDNSAYSSSNFVFRKKVTENNIASDVTFKPNMFRQKVGNALIPSYTALFAIPFPKNGKTNVLIEDASASNSAINVMDQLRLLLEREELTGIRYFDYDIFHNWITYTQEDTTTVKFSGPWAITGQQSYLPCSIFARNRAVWGDDDYRMYATGFMLCGDRNIMIQPEVNVTESYSIAFNFTRNTTQSTFSWTYCPQLLDENYIEFKAGERVGNTSYPIHRLTKSTVYLHATPDLQSGNRIYYITDGSTDNSYSDYYETLITVNTMEYWPMFNDAWESYMAQNYATLKTSYALAAQKSLFSLGEGLFEVEMGSMVRGPEKAFSGIGSFLETVQKTEMKKQNLVFTPDTTKQGNTASSDIMNSALRIMSIITYCSDILYCANYFEKYGYLVNKWFNNATTPLTRKRRRYDYYELDDLVLSPRYSVYPITNDILEDVKDRFRKGIRRWYVGYSDTFGAVGDYTYDNLEV